MIKLISCIIILAILLNTFEIRQNVERQNVDICVNQIKYKLIRIETNFKIDELAKTCAHIRIRNA